jgi:hypothetical protein
LLPIDVVEIACPPWAVLVQEDVDLWSYFSCTTDVSLLSGMFDFCCKLELILLVVVAFFY